MCVIRAETPLGNDHLWNMDKLRRHLPQVPMMLWKVKWHETGYRHKLTMAARNVGRLTRLPQNQIGHHMPGHLNVKKKQASYQTLSLLMLRSGIK